MAARLLLIASALLLARVGVSRVEPPPPSPTPLIPKPPCDEYSASLCVTRQDCRACLFIPGCAWCASRRLGPKCVPVDADGRLLCNDTLPCAPNSLFSGNPYAVCPAEEVLPSRCPTLLYCQTCASQPGCGWCTSRTVFPKCLPVAFDGSGRPTRNDSLPCARDSLFSGGASVCPPSECSGPPGDLCASQLKTCHECASDKVGIIRCGWLRRYPIEHPEQGKCVTALIDTLSPCTGAQINLTGSDFVPSYRTDLCWKGPPATPTQPQPAAGGAAAGATSAQQPPARDSTNLVFGALVTLASSVLVLATFARQFVDMHRALTSTTRPRLAPPLERHALTVLENTQSWLVLSRTDPSTSGNFGLSMQSETIAWHVVNLLCAAAWLALTIVSFRPNADTSEGVRAACYLCAALIAILNRALLQLTTSMHVIQCDAARASATAFRRPRAHLDCQEGEGTHGFVESAWNVSINRIVGENPVVLHALDDDRNEFRMRMRTSHPGEVGVPFGRNLTHDEGARACSLLNAWILQHRQPQSAQQPQLAIASVVAPVAAVRPPLQANLPAAAIQHDHIRIVHVHHEQNASAAVSAQAHPMFGVVPEP